MLASPPRILHGGVCPHQLDDPMVRLVMYLQVMQPFLDLW
jgi:hypothetical protein